jgi:hypothetical protein
VCVQVSFIMVLMSVCFYTCVCMHRARIEEHFYVTIIAFFVHVNIIFWGLCVLCLSPLSYCPCVFLFWSLYLVVCVKVNSVCLCVCVGMEEQGMKNALALPLLFIIKMSIFLCFLIFLSIVYPFINVIKCYGCLCRLFMVRFWCVVCMLRCVPYSLLKRGGCVCRVIQSSYNANNNNSSYKSGSNNNFASNMFH